MMLIQGIGQKTINFLQSLGRSGHFLAAAIFRRPSNRNGVYLIAHEIYSTGVLSLLIIAFSALFIGAVVALQGFNTLEKFNSTPQLGQLIALSITRELGPVISALLFAGRAGSALTAEIGLMKSTDQLTCLEMMGVSPIARVIAPKLWGGIISLPLLGILFSSLAIVGGYWVAVPWLGIDPGVFWSNMQASVDFQMDVMNGIIKSIAFGVVITWIAVFHGYDAIPTAEGIGRATTKTVVQGSIAVLALDFVLTAIMIGGW